MLLPILTGCRWSEDSCFNKTTPTIPFILSQTLHSHSVNISIQIRMKNQKSRQLSESTTKLRLINLHEGG